jgi:uncharacterized protein YukE
MSTPFSLSPAEATAKISQVQSSAAQITSTVNRVDDTQQAMVQKTWNGNSANLYISHAAQQHEDLQNFLGNLHALVDKGVSDMHSFAALDNS